MCGGLGGQGCQCRQCGADQAASGPGRCTTDPQALNGTNRLRLGVFSNARHGQVLLTAVFDNLGKGASGAAVQNLDLMLSGAA